MSVSGRVLKIVVVGDGFVGKTTLLITHTTGTFTEEYIPTVFENYAGQMTVDDKQYAYTLWDTAGQEEFDRCRILCYTQTNVFLVCFAVNSPTSLANVKNLWLPEIRRECGENVPAVLVGTKADLRSSTSENLVKKADCRRFARSQKMHGYVESSAKALIGCTEVFEEAIRAATKPPPSWNMCAVL